MTPRKKSILLLGYAICLIVLVVLKFYGDIPAFLFRIQSNLDYLHAFGQIPMNVVPLRTLRMYAADLPSPIALVNLLGNILPWVPLGVLARWRFPSAKRSRVLFGLALFCLAAELVQLVTFTGSFDIDDWILSFVSGLAGVMVSDLFSSAFPKRPNL